MSDCCLIAPYQPSIWDPHRQAEPVRLWWTSDLEGVSIVFRHRAQGHDSAATRLLKDRFGVVNRFCIQLDHGIQYLRP